jgi:PAS domain S-box-containing protein
MMEMAVPGGRVRMRPLSWWVKVVWGLAFGLLVADLVVALFNVSGLRRNDSLVARAREIKTELALLSADLADAETATHGFVIAGREDFLRPYTAAEESVGRRLDRLRELTGETPEHAARSAALDARVREKFAVLRRMIDVRRGPNGALLAQHMVIAGVGQEVMDKLRAELAGLDRHAESLVEERARTADAAYQSTGYATLVGGGLTLGMAAMAYALARRELAGRQQAEAALRQSLDRFRSLVQAVPQMVCVTDPAGSITQVNNRWVQYTGLAAGQTSDWVTAVHPGEAEAARAAWRDALAKAPDRFIHECRVRSAAGEYRWMLFKAVPLRTDAGLVFQWVATFTDIDDQKRQSEILASLVQMRTRELESANQLLRDEIAERTRAEGRAQAAAVELGRSNEELEKFAYVASHDLQEPLRKIQAFGDRLVKKYRDPLGPEGQEYVDRMKAAATRMRTLIDDLLTFSRVTTKAQPFDRVDLGAIVGDVLSDLEVQVTRTGGTVEVGPLPTVEADPLQMRQLFQNLIGNALKFHKPDLPPRVTVQATPWGAVSDGTDPPPAGDGYRILVADNGIGFDPAYAERVFELFQRLHGRAEYEGTGIGLAICRKIVQRHGGTILARGQPGEGTAFVIDLPAKAGEASRAA